jgi:hypothetical protein
MLSSVNASSGWTTRVWKKRCSTGPVHATNGVVVGVGVVVVVVADEVGSAGAERVVDRASGRGAEPWHPHTQSIRKHSNDWRNRPRRITA